MSKRVRTVISLLLILSMAFSIASCSALEDFFDLGGGSSRSRRERNRDDDDDDDDDDRRTTETSETSETLEQTEPSTSETVPDHGGPVTDVADNGLTYPDHIPTYDEIHPAHPSGSVSGDEAVELLYDIESEILLEAIGGSYVDASILFADYESLGITFEEDETGWGEVRSDPDEELAKTNDILDRLYSIDRDSLPTGDRIFYDKLLYDMELSAYALQYSAFEYYESIFMPLNGPQAEVLFILDVMEFDSVEDAENYILVLRDLDRYYDEICEFEEERASYGYVNSDDVYESVAEDFDNLISQSEDCFLYDSFRTRLDNIQGLSDSDRNALIEEHDEVMHEIVFPEFEECAERMRALKCGAPSVGVCSYPGGDAYYAYIFATQTNSGRTIDESIQQLEAYTSSIMQTMMNVAGDPNSDWMDEYMNHDYSEGDTADNLDYLYEAVQQDFPAIPDHGYRLMTVPEVFADSFSPAAFLGYHLDNFDSNIVITNEAQINNNFGITCAHEGYPGHMYESVYHRAVEDHPYMYIANSIGYSEGWATYVENYSFKYFSSSPASEVVRVENQLNIILFARFDLGINYEGWDAEDCASWYGDLVGMDIPASSIMDAYNLLLSDPGYGIKYGLGFINTGMVMSELQSQFPDASDLEIHTAYLNAGEGSFEQILEYATEALEEGDLPTPVDEWGDEFEGNISIGQGSSTSGGGGLLGH